MLRTSGVPESSIRYYENHEIDDWYKLLASLCILTNDAINIEHTIQERRTINSA